VTEPTRTFRKYGPEQTLIMPTNLKEWLPRDHLAFFIDELVNTLDLSEIYAYYEGNNRGAPPYDPRMQLKICIYAYCNGINSSRRVEKAMIDDVGFRYLGRVTSRTSGRYACSGQGTGRR